MPAGSMLRESTLFASLTKGAWNISWSLDRICVIVQLSFKGHAQMTGSRCIPASRASGPHYLDCNSRGSNHRDKQAKTGFVGPEKI